jgi:PEP-CTERM motif
VRHPSRLPFLLTAALLAAGAAHAEIATYTSQSAYLGAVGTTGVDRFDDLAVDRFDAPLDRAAGAFSYTTSITGGAGYGASDNDADMWLTTGSAQDVITFAGFGTGVAGAGGFFFGSDLFGYSQPIASITITATDSSGTTATHVIANPGTGSFLGFVSTTYLTSLSVAVGANVDGFPTVNDLHISAPVPEPAAYGLMLAGLGVLGCAARRRKA